MLKDLKVKDVLVGGHRRKLTNLLEAISSSVKRMDFGVRTEFKFKLS